MEHSVEPAVSGCTREEDFVAFAARVEPRLRRALVGVRGADVGSDATAEALGWAWEHWDEVSGMASPVAYLYRVGVSRTRTQVRRAALQVALDVTDLPAARDDGVFEPGLGVALAALSERQRGAVILVCGCGWTHREAAAALGISASTVGVHLRRGLRRLRTQLGAAS